MRRGVPQARPESSFAPPASGGAATSSFAPPASRASPSVEDREARRSPSGDGGAATELPEPVSSPTRSDPASTSIGTQQRRLALMFRIGFFLAASMLGAMLVARAAEGTLLAELGSPARWMHVLAVAHLGGLALLTRHVRLRRRSAVVFLDVAGSIGTIALLAADGLFVAARTAGTFNLILATGLVVVLRAVIVPSTATRTLAVSAAGIAVAFAMLAGATASGWPPAASDANWSPTYQLVSASLWLSAFAASAAIASRVVFGLRREVHAARRIGQYVLHEKLGEGGMGIVFRATHALLKRDTAIKLLRPSKVDAATLARFEREVTLTAKLAHPNTIAVFDYGRTPDGAFFYAMEYVDGLTLAELVELTGPLPPGRVVHLLSQVCASLAEAHELGLVHRDVKPANVIVTCRAGIADLVKVLDFGLVKDIAHGDDRSMAGQVLGTPITMSPEALTSPASVGPATDIYAVGAVGYFMLTGRHVFEGDTIVEVCAQHLYEAPVPPSARVRDPIPVELEEVILHALSKHASGRPTSARALRESLLACDVSPWTEEHALGWWRDVGVRELAKRQLRDARTRLEGSPTLRVDFSARADFAAA